METCLWCTASAENDEDVIAVLQRYCNGDLMQQEMQDANNDLIYCMECVVEYHKAREKVPALHKRLWELETTRLLEVFQGMLALQVDDYDLFVIDNGQTQPVPTCSPEEIHNRLRFPLMEVLKYPYLLCHQDLCEKVVNVLCKMEDMKNPFPVHDKYPGTYLLMVHSNEMVRRWAIDAAMSLGRVDRDSYYDLQELFSCMFFVINLGNSGDTDNEENTAYSGKLQRLPSHLYDSKNKKNNWLGVSMLLMQLDSQAMDSLFMEPEMQTSILQCIIKTMNYCNKDEDLTSDYFWPVLHCFMVILDRLGSKIWGQVEPLDAFRAITKAPTYTNEIESIRKNTSGSRVKAEPKDDDDDPVSCSQIVYDRYATERKNRYSDWSNDKVDKSSNVIFEEMNTLVNVLQTEMGQGMRVYGSTFLWFIPFVRSIMELTVLHGIYIGEVIHYLDKNLNKDLLSGRMHTCDKVTEFFVRILVDIIELYLKKGCMGMLEYFTHVWVDVVLQGASLSDDVRSGTALYWRGGSCRVSSTTSNFDSFTKTPAAGVGAIKKSCMNLIHSLLKEGMRVGTVPESTHFFKLIKRYMRETSTRWQILTNDLQKCLIKIVKAISERPGVSNDVVPCAPPTPPIDPPENLVSHPTSAKDPLHQRQTSEVEADLSSTRDDDDLPRDESLSDYEQNRDFCKGLEDDFKVKKESVILIPISDFSPKLKNMKPDFEKIQEIKIRLNDPNLSKIQEIERRLKAEQQGQTGEEFDLRPYPTISLAATRDPVNLSELSIAKEKKKKWIDDDDDDDDEPLNIRRRRLKSCHRLSGDSKDERLTSEQCKTANVDNESNIITISDDEVSTNNTTLKGENCLFDSAVNRVVREPSLDNYLNKSPSRDFDCLSESQVFEFETQQDVPSVWGDTQIDGPAVDKKLKVNTVSEASNARDKVDPMSNFGLGTQCVQESDIEKACQQAEEQMKKLKQLQEPAPSSLLLSSKTSSSREKFVKPNFLKSPPKKPCQTEKYKLCPARKPVIIEALGQKLKPTRSRSAFCQDHEKPSSSTTQTLSPASSRGPSLFSATRPISTPLIVPPKKVRKRVAPELPVELLGLKKKARKAFDYSQRTLDSLGELRSHGQTVHIEQQQKSKRVSRNSKPQPKLARTGGKKLLDSQGMQYLRQSRGKLQKPMSAAVVPTSLKKSVPVTLPEPKCTVRNAEEQDEEDFLLPCSQPDPARRTDSDQAAMQSINVCYSNKEVTDLTEQSKAKKLVAQTNTENIGSTAQSTESKEAVCAIDSDDEWTCLTQNEPTDMELCSQMKEMEEDYGDDFFQKDPASMGADNQPNLFDGFTSVPLKPPPALVSQKVLPATSTRSDQPLTLNAGLPPVCQSKTKPSTAKIYTSNSRIASLAKEMGKNPAPLPAANVAKAKCAKPPPAQPAQPEFRQPLPPKPTLHHAGQVSKPSACNKVTFNPPTYKTYSRPEAPVSAPLARVSPGQRIDHVQTYNPATLKQAVLKWEYHWFTNYKTFGPPDDPSLFPVEKVPVKFSSYDEYFNILYPLLLSNAFEEMVSKWLNGGRPSVNLHLHGIEYSKGIASARFTASLSSEQEMKQLYPKEDDLVLLWLPKNTGAYVNDDPDSLEPSVHFGCVSQCNVYSNGRGKPSTLNLTIETRGNVSSVNSQTVRSETIGSLASTLREFKALCAAKDMMEKPLLLSDIRYFTPCQEGLPHLDMPEYNADQAKAIGHGIAMVKRQSKTPKILLIHGPPGTGKSKTIVGLLQGLLTDSQNPAVNRYAKNRRTRILVCAPSNGAIDHLMKKIIVCFKEKCRNICSPQGNCGDINLVRVGNEKVICKDLKLFSLDSQTKNRMERAQQKSDVDIQRRTGELDLIIDKLSWQCAKAKQDKNMAQFEMLNAMRQEHCKEREQLSRQMKASRDKRQEIQARVLVDANVICCTLSTSGSVVLKSAFRRLGHEPFSCVIVDEAGQAKETETLIPLCFRCPSLILVGDPEQLPPTVVSQKAKEMGYDQSLMARVWKSLKGSNHRPSPMVFLSVQYRMHPSICEFPSKYIYGCNLKSDCEMAQKRCSASWPFEPYRVFDVTDGVEYNENDSYSNQKEVTLVLLLLKLLYDKQPEKLSLRIGVITPYNAQKRRIEEAFSKELREGRFHQGRCGVEVDTVDGFQGREMDCIIVSCVRASNEMGSIGFVGNRQRMNVTITRAKFSLLILGHIRTLKGQSDWGALIDDAAKRGVIISTAEPDFYDTIKKVLKPVRLSRSISHPPDHVSNPSTSTANAYADRPRDHRPPNRNLDPRLSASNQANREWNKGNRRQSQPRPSSYYSTDHWRQQRSSHSSRSASEPGHEHTSFSDSSSRHRR